MGECIFAWISVAFIFAIDLQCRVAWLDLITKHSCTTVIDGMKRDISNCKRIFLRHWHKPELAKKINQKVSSFSFLSFRKFVKFRFSMAWTFLWFRFSNSLKRKILKNDTTYSRAYKNSRTNSDAIFFRRGKQLCCYISNLKWRLSLSFWFF